MKKLRPISRGGEHSRELTSRRILVMALVLIMVVPLFLPMTGSSKADQGKTVEWVVKKLDEPLPMPVYRGSLVWTGEKAYLISGRDDKKQLESIIEFDPSTGRSVLMKAQFPKARVMFGSAWVPPYAYIFGGANFTESQDDVVRYEPSKDTVEVMPYTMPEPRKGLTAVEGGDGKVYISGGKNLTQHVAKVMRFDPGTGDFTFIDPFPTTGGGRSGVYGNGKVYVFGGECEGKVNCKTAFEIDPKTGTNRVIEVSDTELMGDYYYTSAAWTGRSALIFGGNDFNKTLDRIIEFVPKGTGNPPSTKDEFRLIGHFPIPLELTAAFYNEKTGKAYILGGRSTIDSSDAIYVVEKKTVGNDDPAGFIPERSMTVMVSVALMTIALIMARKRYSKLG